MAPLSLLLWCVHSAFTDVVLCPVSRPPPSFFFPTSDRIIARVVACLQKPLLRLRPLGRLLLDSMPMMEKNKEERDRNELETASC